MPRTQVAEQPTGAHWGEYASTAALPGAASGVVTGQLNRGDLAAVDGIVYRCSSPGTGEGDATWVQMSSTADTFTAITSTSITTETLIATVSITTQTLALRSADMGDGQSPGANKVIAWATGLSAAQAPALPATGGINGLLLVVRNIDPTYAVDVAAADSAVRLLPSDGATPGGAVELLSRGSAWYEVSRNGGAKYLGSMTATLAGSAAITGADLNAFGDLTATLAGSGALTGALQIAISATLAGSASLTGNVVDWA